MTGVQFSIEHGLGDAVIGHPHGVRTSVTLYTLDVMFDTILCAALYLVSRLRQRMWN